MQRYKITIEYDGTPFVGWQFQKNGQSVQEVLQKAIFNFSREKVIVTGAGRTDSGVHANCQVANFKVNTEIALSGIKRAINSKINKDIHIKSCTIVNDIFNSRYSAIKRNYIYNMSTTYNVFNRNHEWYIKFKLDKNKLIKCSEIVLKQNNFKNFCKVSSQSDNNQCKIFFSNWVFENNTIKYNVVGDRFLHHMVRFLVGTMVEVSKGRFTIDQFKSFFNKNKAQISVVRAPAKGLLLNDIEF